MHTRSIPILCPVALQSLQYSNIAPIFSNSALQGVLGYDKALAAILSIYKPPVSSLGLAYALSVKFGNFFVQNSLRSYGVPLLPPPLPTQNGVIDLRFLSTFGHS